MAAFPTALLATLAILALHALAEKQRNGHAVQDYSEQCAFYTASWAVEIIQGGEKMTDHVAKQYGFNNLGKVMSYIIAITLVNQRVAPD